MKAEFDVRQLAIRREHDSPDGSVRRSRHLLSRYVFPGGILLGFLGLIAWSGRAAFFRAAPVTVAPVISSVAEVQESGTPLFQAAGWIEPRPTPVLVTALAEGVVAELLVVEGQEVKVNQPVARLVDADARLILRTAEAARKLAEAEVQSARAALEGTRTNLQSPVQLVAAVAEAEAMLARMETDLAALPAQRRAAEARLRQARQAFEGKKTISTAGALPDLQYIQAETELESAEAQVQELKAREPRVKVEIEALRRKRGAQARRLELKADEKRAQEEALAQVKAAEARLENAEIKVETARLCLDRMTVRSPIEGRVLALVAKPGMRLMGLATGAHQESSTVVSLYNPLLLQVRADVRLEDVPRVEPGQPVRIETPVVPDKGLEGEVLFPTSLADIQKNTLQVKVALRNPPAVLKPDMLVQVTFLAPAKQGAGKTTARSQRLFIPRSLIDTSGGGTRVWLADLAGGTARHVAIKPGTVLRGELIEVVDGLQLGDRLIVSGRESLQEGQRIEVTGEDASLGLSVPIESAPKVRISRAPMSQPEHKGKH